MNYIDVARKIHQTAKDKGWWENERPTDKVYALVTSELYEGMEADRSDHRASIKLFNEYKDKTKSDHQYIPDSTPEEAWKYSFENYIKDSVEDELADTFIRCLDYLFYRHREHFTIPQVNGDWKKDFASNIFSINKVLCRYEINVAAGMIVSLANYMDIDLDWHIKQKMKYNDLRSYKHGGKKY